MAWSLPLRKCGLKLHTFGAVFRTVQSLPLRKCGLKPVYCNWLFCFVRHFPCGSVDWNSPMLSITSPATSSLPLRKCGLKPLQCKISCPSEVSLPLRKCGLKHYIGRITIDSHRHFPCGSVDWNQCDQQRRAGTKVTSLAEVWIETTIMMALAVLMKCHFPCGSVDWNALAFMPSLTSFGHFPCGSVDWNSELTGFLHSVNQSLPLRKCGLKLDNYIGYFFPVCHFPCGSVDWNWSKEKVMLAVAVTSLAKVWIETGQ